MKIKRELLSFGVCLTLSACGLILMPSSIQAAVEARLMPHDEYVAQYRALGAQSKHAKREELLKAFLREAEEYIAAHPNGPEIAQAKLNKALAIGLYGLRKDDESDRLLAEIVSDHPESPLVPEAMHQRAWLRNFAFGRARLKEGREIALELVERFPNSKKAPLALVRASHSFWVDVKDADTATKLYTRVLEDYPGTAAELEARRDLINIAIDKGAFESAQEQIDAFLGRRRQSPDMVPAETWARFLCWDVGPACLRIEDWERAEQVFQAVIEDYPGQESELRARAELIRLAISVGDEASALAQIKASFDRRRQSPNMVTAETWAWFLSADVGPACVRIEDWGRAEQAFQAVIEDYPGQESELRARAELIHLAIRIGNEASALAQIDDFLERYKTIPEGVPPIAWAHLFTRNLADACRKRQAWDRAEQCHRTVLRVLPDGEAAREAWLALAWVCGAGFGGERFEERASILLDVVKRDPAAPDAPSILMDAASCYEWNIQDKAKARELYERIIEAYPDTRQELDARVHLVLMTLYCGDVETANERIRAFDRLLKEEPDEGHVRKGKLILAKALNSFYGNNPSRTTFRGRAIKRFLAIADAYPGSEEAAEALYELACHYARTRDRDVEQATHYVLRLLRDHPQQNRKRYARAVTEIMQNRELLLAPLEGEMLQKAHKLLERYSHFACHESHRFFMKADSLHGAKWLEKQVRKIIKHAEEQDNEALVKDALLFMSESYLRKRRPEEALRRLTELDRLSGPLGRQDELRALETRAFSYVLCGKPIKAIPVLEQLVARTPEPANVKGEELRTKAYYEYWQAVARFDQGRYAASASLFERLRRRYPSTSWAGKAAQYVGYLLPLLGNERASLDARG